MQNSAVKKGKILVMTNKIHCKMYKQMYLLLEKVLPILAIFTYRGRKL